MMSKILGKWKRNTRKKSVKGAGVEVEVGKEKEVEVENPVIRKRRVKERKVKRRSEEGAAVVVEVTAVVTATLLKRKQLQKEIWKSFDGKD